MLGVASRNLPTFGASDQDGRPHIEADRGGYQYVVSERGQELERTRVPDLDGLLFVVFAQVTFGMAVAYELAHRDPQRDCRRLIFEWQSELMGRLSPEWAQQIARQQQETLRAHPYDDFGSVRAVLTKELRDQGHPDDEAWRRACQRYPLP